MKTSCEAQEDFKSKREVQEEEEEVEGEWR